MPDSLTEIGIVPAATAFGSQPVDQQDGDNHRYATPLATGVRIIHCATSGSHSEETYVPSAAAQPKAGLPKILLKVRNRLPTGDRLEWITRAAQRIRYPNFGRGNQAVQRQPNRLR